MKIRRGFTAGGSNTNNGQNTAAAVEEAMVPVQPQIDFATLCKNFTS